MPVDQYIGGIEHAIMHLMYFRFYHKLLRDAGLVHSDEPADRLLCQGMVVAETFSQEAADGSRDWINPADVVMDRDERGKVIGARLASDGSPVAVGAVEKMSKSKNNGVDPQGLVDRYGADTVRLFSMFAAPPDQSLEWSESGVEGSFRFLRRLWALIMNHLEQGEVPVLDVAVLTDEQRELRRLVHDTIAKVSDDIGRRFTFNTAIAALMELTNHLARFDDESAQGRAVAREGWTAIVQLMAPVTPHISEALWEALGQVGALQDAGWPEPDERARVKTAVQLVVQVNGKLRARIETVPGCAKEEALEQALAEANVQRFMEGKSVRKVIHVPDRLLNIVVG